MHMVLWNQWAFVTYDPDGHLWHFDKTGKHFARYSRESWPDFESAKKALAGQVTWAVPPE